MNTPNRSGTLAADALLARGTEIRHMWRTGMKGITVSLSCPDAAKGRSIFEALSAGGVVTKTFWTDGFGMCTDRFGTSWMVNAGGPGGTAEK